MVFKIERKKTRYTLTLILVILNLLFFFINYVTNGNAVLSNTHPPSPKQLLDVGGYNHATSYWMIISAMFQHANIYHLIGNMIALVSVGASIERLFGKIPYLITYIVASFVAFIISGINDPHMVIVGASASIMALTGMLFIGALIMKQQALLYSLIYSILFTFGYGFYFNTINEHTQISNLSHFVGLIVGLVFGIITAIFAKMMGQFEYNQKVKNQIKQQEKAEKEQQRRAETQRKLQQKYQKKNKSKK